MAPLAIKVAARKGHGLIHEASVLVIKYVPMMKNGSSSENS